MYKISFKDNIDNFKKTAKILGIVGGAIYTLALFMDAYTGILPFIGSLTIRLSQYIGDLGILLVIIGGTAIACSFFKKGVLQAVSGTLGLIFAIIIRASLQPKLDDPSLYLTLDIAPYMLFVGSILIIAAGVLCKYTSVKEKQIVSTDGQPDSDGEKTKTTPEQIKFQKQEIKKKVIRILKIAGPIVGGIALIVLINYIFGTVIPRSHFEKGMTAYDAEDYATAINEFTKARNYENAPDMLADSETALHYHTGMDALNSGDYDLAHTELLAAGEYQDAQEQAAYAELGIHYHTGQTLLENGEYEEAINEFELAESFPGTQDKVYQAYYELASEQYQSGDYESAALNYSLSYGYEDADDMIISMGNEYIDSGDYATAASFYQYSTDERYEAYALGMEEMNNGDYNPAIDYFVTAEDVFDAADRVTECRYIYGIELLCENDYSAATANLGLISGYQDADLVNLVASAEKANQERDLVTAVNNYSQIPEDFTINGFDVQSRRAIFTGEEATAFAQFCAPYEVESIDASCVSRGNFGTYGGWELTELIPDQGLRLHCRYENESFTLTGSVHFFIFTEYSYIRNFTEGETTSRNFTLEGITSPPSSYEFEDGTTITFSADRATVNYHQSDNYAVGMNYVYDTEEVFVRQ